MRESVEALKNDLPIDYDHFYNQTGCGQLGSTCLQDLAETFIQRQKKERDGVVANRAEHFWDVLAGRYADVDSLTGKLIGYLGNAELAFASLFDATFNALLGQVAGGWARMLSNPPTDADMADQLARLQKHAEALQYQPPPAPFHAIQRSPFRQCHQHAEVRHLRVMRTPSR